MSELRTYFNSIASGWDAAAIDDGALQSHLRRFGVAPGERILDIGAGTGRMTRLLSHMTGDEGAVIAQDFALEMLHTGKKLLTHPNVYWICNDCRTLALKSGQFDRIICFSVFPHIADRTTALEEIFRVLKTGGKLLILHTQGSRELNAFHASLDSIVRHDRLPPAETLAFSLTQSGFHVLNVEERSDLYWVEAEK